MDNLVTSISPLAIDVILAILILLVAALKARAGIYHSVMAIVVVVLAIAIGFVGAKLLEEPVSDYAWTKYGPKIEREFDEKVEAALGGDETLSEVFQHNWNNLISSFAEAFNSDNINSLQINTDDEDIDYTDTEMVQKLKAFTLAKAKLLCNRVCLIGLFGLCTAVALLVLTIIKNIIGEVAEVSVIGWVNHLLGFVFGAVEMIVIMLLIVRGAGLLGITFFQDLSEGTVLLNWLIGGDLESALQVIQNFTFEDIKNIDIEDLTTVDFESVGEQVKDILSSFDVDSTVEAAKDVVESVK